MADAHIGITLRTHFASSTCWILQSFHGLAAEPLKLIWSSLVVIADLESHLLEYLDISKDKYGQSFTHQDSKTIYSEKLYTSSRSQSTQNSCISDLKKH